jgi:hypothetical protein
MEGKRKMQGNEIARNGICKDWKLQGLEIARNGNARK